MNRAAISENIYHLTGLRITWYGTNGVWHTDSVFAYHYALDNGWFDWEWDHTGPRPPEFQDADYIAPFVQHGEDRPARFKMWRNLDRWSSHEGKWSHRFYNANSIWAQSMLNREPWERRTTQWINRRYWLDLDHVRTVWKPGTYRDRAKKRDKRRNEARTEKVFMNAGGYEMDGTDQNSYFDYQDVYRVFSEWDYLFGRVQMEVQFYRDVHDWADDYRCEVAFYAWEDVECACDECRMQKERYW